MIKKLCTIVFAQEVGDFVVDVCQEIRRCMKPKPSGHLTVLVSAAQFVGPLYTVYTLYCVVEQRFISENE